MDNIKDKIKDEFKEYNIVDEDNSYLVLIKKALVL